MDRRSLFKGLIGIGLGAVITPLLPKPKEWNIVEQKIITAKFRRLTIHLKYFKPEPFDLDRDEMKIQFREYRIGLRRFWF